MTNHADGAFLQSFFNELDKRGIEYAVLRNYEKLPYTSSGSDIDIYINPNSSKVAIDALEQTMHSTGAHSLGLVSTATFYENYIIGFAESGIWGVCIEFYFGIFYKGSFPLIDENRINKAITRHNGISVLENDIGNSLGFIKEILVHDSFRKDKPQYEQSVKLMLENHGSVFHEYFSPLGKNSGSWLLKVVNSSDERIRTANIKKFRRYALLQIMQASPVTCILGRLAHEFQRIKRFLFPSGTVLAVLGVDGSGKSTLIDSIKPALKDATHNAVFYEHLRPNLLPPLARLKGVKTTNSGPVINPHGSTPSGFLGSLFRMIYLMTDYIAGYWLKIRPLIAKRPAIVIFDRYAYDMAFDQRRFRINLPSWLVRCFARLAPKPDLIFCLYGSPEVLAARKQELPLAEVTRQVNALKAFAATEPRAILVNTEQSIEVCRDQILQAIAAHCDHRARQ